MSQNSNIGGMWIHLDSCIVEELSTTGFGENGLHVNQQMAVAWAIFL